MLIFRLLPVITTAFLLNACANPPEKVQEAEKPVAVAKAALPKAKPQTKQASKDIDPDVLFMVLTAELAGQRGQYDIALEGYMEAAKRVNDAQFAEKATMVAMYLKDVKKTNEAVNLWLKKDAKNAIARKIASLLALQIGDKAAAVTHLNELQAINPNGFETALLELASAQKDSNASVLYDVLETLSAKHPEQAAIYFAQSLAAMQMKNTGLAASKIQRVLSLRPDWDKALIFQAQIAALSGDMEKAKTQLKSAVEKYPQNNHIKRLLAQVLIKQEAYEDAIKIYQNLIANEPKDTESQLALGLIHLQLSQDTQAEAVFKKLTEQPERQYQANFYLGKLAEKKGDNQAALQYFDRVSNGPMVFDASVAAVALLAKNKQFDVAQSRLKQLKAQFPNQEMRILLTQAEVYSQEKQYDKAFKLLSDALAKQPDQTDLLYTRALMAEHVGKLNVLESDLRKILAKEPNNVAALNALGYTLLDHANRYGEAESYLQKAIKLQPNEAVIMDSYGWLQFKLGRLDVALDYLQRAYKKQPENEIAAHLAEVLWALNKKSEARELFDKVIKLTPSDEYLLDFQRRILNKVD